MQSLDNSTCPMGKGAEGLDVQIKPPDIDNSTAKEIELCTPRTCRFWSFHVHEAIFTQYHTLRSTLDPHQTSLARAKEPNSIRQGQKPEEKIESHGAIIFLEVVSCLIRKLADPPHSGRKPAGGLPKKKISHEIKALMRRAFRPTPFPHSKAPGRCIFLFRTERVDLFKSGASPSSPSRERRDRHRRP